MDFLTDEGLTALAENCPSLFFEPARGGCKETTDEGLESLSEKCSNLMDLYLSVCVQITNDGLKTLTEKMSSFYFFESLGM